jgi:hypothetical protein
MIKLDYYPFCELHNLQEIELADYKAFFEFFIAYNDKGVIFNVKEVPPRST